MANQSITISAEDLANVQNVHGVLVLNKDKHKLTNLPKGFVWRVTTETFEGEQRRESTILYKKLENAIQHLTSEYNVLQNYSGDIRTPKVIGVDHIYVHGLNCEGKDLNITVTTQHIF